MSDLSRACAAALSLEMRSPLARIELLASQLAREGATPRARSLACAISEAVGEIDLLIARSLELLAPSAWAPPGEADLRPVLSAVRERLAPALAARGLRWLDQPSPDAVVGDPSLAREALVNLLREAAARAGNPAELELTLRGDAEGYGFHLRWRSDRVASCDEGPTDALRRFAGANGATLAWHASSDEGAIELRLPRREAGCSAS